MSRIRTLGAAAAASLLLAACGSNDDTQPAAQSGDAAGTGAEVATDADGEPFSLLHMSHTFAETSRAWDGESDDGTFTYVSAPCNFDAPVNNNATNLTTFNARLPDTSSPGSTRFQPLEFEVTSGDDGTGELQGTITMTVCHLQRGPTPEDDPVPDPEKENITFDFSARYEQTSDEEIAWFGSFDITGGTGTYEGISGSGELSGYFTCAFQPDDCADLGQFTDLQVVMIGTYEHPDVTG